MSTKFTFRRRVALSTALLAPLLALTMLLVLLGGATVQAQGPEDGPPRKEEGTAGAAGWGDDGIIEVGVEWINDFPGTADDRSHWDESCDGLYNKLRAKGWTGGYRYTDWNGWEKDFKDESRGGWEDSVADRVDISMLCTHGSGSWDNFWNKSLSSVYFGSTHDDHHLIPGDAYRAYGDKDMEWLAFDACSVLGGGPAPYYNRGYWAATMDGLHLLLGFRNTMYVWAPGDGYKWADYMLGWCPSWWPFGCLRPPYKVTQAWFEAVDDVQPGGVCARVLAEVNNNYNDYLWGKGYVSPDPTPDGNYWYWDHCSCTPPPRQIADVGQIETLPVYKVLERQVDENYVLEVASAFDLSGEVHTGDDYLYMLQTTDSETFTLQVDMTTGGYKYRKLSELWVSPVDPPALLAERQVRQLGDEFFTGDGQSLPGAAYRTGDTLFQTEEQVEVESLSNQSGVIRERELTRLPVNQSLSYGRILSPVVRMRTANGPAAVAQPISLVGPGARAKMYFGDLGSILGVQGGSRDVELTGEEVTILDPEKAWDMYLADPQIALIDIPWVADVISKTAQTLSYYEQPHFTGQQTLIPAWVFTADFYAGGELLAEGVFVYVPAALDYLPPMVEIQSPISGATFEVGQTFTLSGTVTEYGQPPFTYSWHSNDVGLLGSGPSLEVALPAAAGKSGVTNHIIKLKVADANGQQGAATIEVYIKPALYLPLIAKE